MKDYIDDETKHKKKSNKKKSKKSNHKHDYEFIPDDSQIFDFCIIGNNVCKICGKITSATIWKEK